MHFNGGGALKGVILHHSLSHPGEKEREQQQLSGKCTSHSP